MRLWPFAALMVLATPAEAGVALDACALRAANPFEAGFEKIGAYIIVDTQIAIDLCTKAMTAEPGPQVSAWLARALYLGGRFDEALTAVKAAVDAKNPLGLEVAGEILMDNLASTVSDPTRGIALLTEASDMGFAPAQNSLGYAYEVGNGVPLDPDKAMELYLLAAAQGLGVAESNVGIHYRDGLGELEVDLDAALAWFEKAAAHGDPGGQDALGYAYQYGQGVPQDSHKAVYYYGLAADQGDANALGNLAYSYDAGDGVAQDYVKALELYHKADAAGSQWVAPYIGAIYLDGLGVPQDVREAKRWIDKGLESEDNYAQYLMGRIAEEGIGTRIDLDSARGWYRKAADGGSEEARTALERLGT